jgi:hypothetical protein
MTLDFGPLLAQLIRREFCATQSTSRGCIVKKILMLVTLLGSMTGSLTYSKDLEPSSFKVAKGSEDKPLFMKFRVAEAYCARRESHLPSAQEFAQLATKFGAKTYTNENDFYRSEHRVPGHHDKVYVDSPGASYDNYKVFYFNPENYSRPQSDLGMILRKIVGRDDVDLRDVSGTDVFNGIWSSSTLNGGGAVWLWQNESGAFGYTDPNFGGSAGVVCIRDN